MRRLRLYATGFGLAILTMTVGGLGYLLLGFHYFGADAAPSKLDTMMTSSRHASVRRAAPRMTNPLPVSDEVLIQGGKTYLEACAGCHGEPGKPQASYGAAFRPPARAFNLAGTEFSEAEIFWIARHGLRRTGMSAEAESFPDRELWQVTAFIRSMRTLPPSVLRELKLPPFEPPSQGGAQ